MSNTEFYTIEDLAQYNTKRGFYWFSPNTVRGFNTRFASKIHVSREKEYVLFTQSDKHQNTRLYSLCVLSVATGAADRVGGYYNTMAAAQKDAAILAQYKRDDFYCLDIKPVSDQEGFYKPYEVGIRLFDCNFSIFCMLTDDDKTHLEAYGKHRALYYALHIYCSSMVSHINNANDFVYWYPDTPNAAKYYREYVNTYETLTREYRDQHTKKLLPSYYLLAKYAYKINYGHLRKTNQS